MQPDINIWEEPGYAYTGFNQRGGTSNINDPDFTDFPPVGLCTYTAAASYKQLLWQWINGGKLSLDTEIDKSICYVGMYNSELPQLNMIGLLKDTYSTLDNPLYYTDNTQIQSFFYGTITNYNEFANNLEWGASQLYTENYTVVDYRLRRYKGGLQGTAPYSPNQPRNCNSNGLLNVFQSIGIKSFILEIMVRYKTGTGTYAPTSTLCTLKTYTEKTTEWKSEHPIIWAGCQVWYRSNKNGTYSNTKASGYFCELVPCFTLPFKSDVEGIEENVTYTLTMCRTTATRSGYFPIYGATVSELSDRPVGGAVEQRVAGVLIGANRGTLNSIIQSGYRNYWLELDGTDDDNIEYIRRGAAAYGMFFCDDIGNLAASGGDVLRWIDDNMCLGTIDNQGLTNGDYTHGLENVTQRQFTWKTTTESDYDPTKPPPSKNTYSNITTFNDISNIATLTRRYALSTSAVEALGSALWQISSDIINNIQNDEWNKYTAELMDTFLTTNPIDCIVSLEKYPLTIPEKSGPVNVKLGKVETSVSADITAATTHTYYFEPVKINPVYWNSFLDYEPYTHFELYIPFCGTVTLSPRDILGRTLSVNLIVDFTTGTCVAYVLSDQLVIETVNGKISISIPVTGIDSTTIASQITNGILNTRNARYTHQFTSLSKIASPGGIIGNIYNLWGSAQSILTTETSAKAAEYDLTHQDAPPHIIGSASPVGSWAIDFQCRLLIYYPTGDVIDNSKQYPNARFNDTVLQHYLNTVGVATVEPGVIGSYRGLLIGTKINLDGMTTANGRPATAEELQMIAEAIETGIII